MSIEYPKTIYRTGRKTAEKNVIFSVDTDFHLPEENDSPLVIFNKKFSKFKFNYVENSNGKTTAVSVNLDLDKISLIKEKTNFILNKIFEREISGIKEETKKENKGICWTPFSMGEFKGKSPAEIILTSTNLETDMQKLNNQYQFLKQNCEKFPKNKILMDAITDAAKKHKEGELKKEDIKESTSNGTIFNIIEKDFKYPRISKKDEQGYTRYTNCSIKCDLGQTNPFIITITNGSVHVDGDKPDNNTKDVMQKSFVLTTEEFTAIVDIMYNRKLEFEICNFNRQHKIAVDNAWKPQ